MPADGNVPERAMDLAIERVRNGELHTYVARDCALNPEWLRRRCKAAGISTARKPEARGAPRANPLPWAREEAKRRGRVGMRAMSESAKRISKRTLAASAEEYPKSEHPRAGHGRPKTRGACRKKGLGDAKPCPFVSCQWHLYLDVTPAGSIRYNHPDREPWELKETCALAVAERGAHTLDDVGACINLTRERVRQVETRAAAAILATGGAYEVVASLFGDGIEGTEDKAETLAPSLPIVRRYLPVVRATPPAERPVLDAEARALAASRAAMLSPKTWLRPRVAPVVAPPPAPAPVAPPHTGSRTQRALDLVLAGATFADAARAVGVNVTSVYRARAHFLAYGKRPQRRVRVRPTKTRRRVTEALARAVERVRNGEPALRAGAAEGVNSTYLGRVCKRLGVPMHPPHKIAAKPEAVARAVERALRGESVAAAARAEGVPRETVKNRIAVMRARDGARRAA